jgi:hypothetical protein
MEQHGVGQFDLSCAEPARMMYGPAANESAFQYRVFDGAYLVADDWLAIADSTGITERLATVQAGKSALETDFDEDSEPTERQVERAHGILKKYIKQLETLQRKDTGEEFAGRNSALFAMMVTLYQLVDGGCLDLQEVETPMWHAAQRAKGNEPWTWSEHQYVTERARRKADEVGPGRPTVENDFEAWDDDADQGDGTTVRTGPNPHEVDVTNAVDAAEWLIMTLGMPGSRHGGVFRRGFDLVHTPRVGENGYEPPKDGDDGPAQVRRLNEAALAARFVAKKIKVYRMRKGGERVRAVFPTQVFSMFLAAPDELRAVRDLEAITHTPLVRKDGSILDKPGYDQDTRTLYLPPEGLEVDLARHGGLGLLEELVVDFPFQTEHDKANYLAALLTPVLRLLVPPPYPLIAVGAPQPGAGKSLCTSVMRLIHGGVFRSEMPRDVAELRKQITAILDTTSAPVVTFDNMAGVLRSAVLDGLLTSREWTDRILGRTEDRTMRNDRLWTITGNNLALGGDLKRRTIWVTIDPRMEHPETRVDFLHPDLEGWVEANRGRLLAALLGVVSDWVVAGRPLVEAARSDSFAVWQQVCDSILQHAGLVGRVNHPDSIRETGLEDEEEWGSFLQAAYLVCGDKPFTVAKLLDSVGLEGGLPEEALPEDVLAKRGNHTSTAKTLGKWFRYREGRWAGGLSVRDAGKKSNTALWQIVDTNTKLL